MRLIFLIIIGLGSLCYGDFSRENGIVTDSRTKIEWQDKYGENNQSAKYTTWKGAVNYCKTLRLDGYKWRLPTRKELIAIVDYGKIDKSISDTFKHTIGFFYWTSTSQSKFQSNAWRVSFNSGYTNYSNKLGKSNVRCMRKK